MLCTEQADVRGFFDGSFGTSMDDASHKCVACASGIHYMARQSGEMLFSFAFQDIQAIRSEADKSPIDTLQAGKDGIFDLIAF